MSAAVRPRGRPAARSGDLAALGPLFDASHASLREDFEVSCEELDVVCAVAVETGAVGAGMTGGVLYLRLQPHLNFDETAIKRRLAKGAKVVIQEAGESDLKNLRELITIYADELKHNHQNDESQKALNLLVDWKNIFVRVVPLGKQEEQRFATE